MTMGLKLEKNPNWKGGRSVTSHGYSLIKADPEKYTVIANGYAYEHKFLMERKLGRKLRHGEIVHHINHDRRDNRIENLMLCGSPAEHKGQHRGPGSVRRLPGDPNPLIKCACGCGKTLRKYDSHGRPRRCVAPHNAFRGTGRRNRIEHILCACGCGVEINRYDKWGRERRFISGHNPTKGNSHGD